MGTTDNFFDEKREWSVLKDQILDYYLRPYLAKILSSGRPTRIADCFAGKGRFDDGNDGSPLIISSHMAAARKRSPDADIKGVFIEKKYAAELDEALSSFGDLCTVLEGDYEDRISYFLANPPDRDRNYFLYVDPYGIKSVAFRYFAEAAALRLRSLEILLNFNTTGFLREGLRLLKLTRQLPDWAEDLDYEADGKNTPEHMDDIAGGRYWRDILQDFEEGACSFHEAESRFTDCYAEALGSVFRYVVNIPIKERSHHLPKYRLVFAGNHAAGLFLMVDSMNSAWRALREAEKHGQLYLFDETALAAMEHRPARDLVWEALQEPRELEQLLVELVTAHGIAYTCREYIDAIRTSEEDCFAVERTPELTPKGRKATSMNYDDYTIVVSRLTKQENLF
jgi:three-Cys-motif partner protein